MVFVVHFIDIWESLLYKPSLGIHFLESHLYRRDFGFLGISVPFISPMLCILCVLGICTLCLSYSYIYLLGQKKESLIGTWLQLLPLVAGYSFRSFSNEENILFLLVHEYCS